MAYTGSLPTIICIGTTLDFKQMLIRVTVVPFASPHLSLLLNTSINWQPLYNFNNGSILPLCSLGNLVSSSPQFSQKIFDYELAHSYHAMFLLQVCQPV